MYSYKYNLSLHDNDIIKFIDKFLTSLIYVVVNQIVLIACLSSFFQMLVVQGAILYSIPSSCGSYHHYKLYRVCLCYETNCKP